jgi:endonuclease/exonuclease/phosphatase (EEP) superfamily protein YafD
MNLRYDNATPGKALSLIGRTKPDVVTLDEVSDMWRSKLALLSAAYPHSIFCPYPNLVFGVAILSRRPFAAGSEPVCFERGAMAVATVDFGGQEIDVAALHLAWPWPSHQAWQIGAISEPLSELSESALLAGDLNATPWSAAARRVAEAGALTLAPSAGPTWLYWRLPGLLRFAGLPIDNVLFKGDVVVHDVRTLEETGSDHLPVLVEFSLRPARDPDSEAKTAIASAAR